MPFLFEDSDDTLYEGTVNETPIKGLDYIAETDKTASGVFRCDHVGHVELINILSAVARRARDMDKYKKTMFRKRTREEAGLWSDEFMGPALSIPDEFADLFHGIIGNITEVGEQAEILINFLETGQVDMTNVREEIGDNLWYLSRLMKFANTTFLTEMKRNVAKLRARHGDSFNKERDTNRDLATERKVLEE